MYLREVFKGRYHKRPTVTDFPNAKNLDEIYNDIEEEVMLANSVYELKDGEVFMR